MRIEDTLNTSMMPNVQIPGVNNVSPVTGEEEKVLGKVQGAKKGECQTCKERKYQDGSDEMVSFKAAAHISPESAASAVMAHEQEHVANAYKKAALGNGKVLQASVRLQMAVCPECGRSYVSGGSTTTTIKYKEDDPYGKERKAIQAEAFKGNHVDEEV